MKRALTIGLCCLVLAACRRDIALPGDDGPIPFHLQLPPGFPMPTIPDDGPLTQQAVEMGRLIFFDKRLSRDMSISCASCHHPSRAFSDTVPLSRGVEGRLGMRNSPPLINLAWHTEFFRDGGAQSLEIQALAPIHDPVEMDFDVNQAAARLREDERIRYLSRVAYGRDVDPFTITRALGAYQRVLISGWSRWDRYRMGDASALTPTEERGWEIFSGSEAGCTACHSGFDLSDHSYRNIGQYAQYSDPGRERISLDPADLGKFKVPTLRNVALTAPYMHDGAMATLEEVVDHFASGGLDHPQKDPAVRAFSLDAQQRADLIAFLHALTDERPIDPIRP